MTAGGMSVEYELTQEEFISGIYGTIARKRSTWVIVLVGTAVLAVGAATSTGLVFIGAALVFSPLLGAVLGAEIGGRRRWKRRPGGPVTLSVSEAYVSMVGPSARAELEWSHFLRLDCSGDLFLFKRADNPLVMIIPRRAFGSDEQADTFRDFVRSHLGKRS